MWDALEVVAWLEGEESARHDGAGIDGCRGRGPAGAAHFLSLTPTTHESGPKTLDIPRPG